MPPADVPGFKGLVSDAGWGRGAGSGWEEQPEAAVRAAAVNRLIHSLALAAFGSGIPGFFIKFKLLSFQVNFIYVLRGAYVSLKAGTGCPNLQNRRIFFGKRHMMVI